MNYIPTSSSTRRKNLDFTNAVASLHGLVCDCTQPLEHSIDIIVNQEPNLKFNNKTSEKLKKCLTTDDGPTAADAIDGLNEGELENLFAEDITEDTG
ncbi:MAG: hypothetical protein [Anelloviridae sp.]|nr:MAG: hypothetical protein [Anelloviridae sp.]